MYYVLSMCFIYVVKDTILNFFYVMTGKWIATTFQKIFPLSTQITRYKDCRQPKYTRTVTKLISSSPTTRQKEFFHQEVCLSQGFQDECQRSQRYQESISNGCFCSRKTGREAQEKKVQVKAFNLKSVVEDLEDVNNWVQAYRATKAPAWGGHHHPKTRAEYHCCKISKGTKAWKDMAEARMGK